MSPLAVSRPRGKSPQQARTHALAATEGGEFIPAERVSLLACCRRRDAVQSEGPGEPARGEMLCQPLRLPAAHALTRHQLRARVFLITSTGRGKMSSRSATVAAAGTASSWTGPSFIQLYSLRRIIRLFDFQAAINYLHLPM